jgi:hypothetical protein
MAQAEHPDLHAVPHEPWDGRARCRLCTDDWGIDQDWCPAAEALVCDKCCALVIGGEPERLRSAATSAAQDMAPMEILTACAACPRFMDAFEADGGAGHAGPGPGEHH